MDQEDSGSLIAGEKEATRSPSAVLGGGVLLEPELIEGSLFPKIRVRTSTALECYNEVDKPLEMNKAESARK